jgi:3-deoxy-D-manno-octulosonic-acid transferase
MPLLLDALYLLALAVLSPWLVWRAVATGRYRRGLGAKLLGRVRVPNPDGKPVAWFHGVSVGEVHLLGTLAAAFRKRHPDWLVVVSSTTDTGLDEARKRFAELPVIAYPFDFSWAVAAALDAVRPSLVVLAESEMWPNFLAAAARRNVPVAVVNARMSPRSFARLRRLAALARRLMFRHVAAFAVQSPDYADRLRQLGVDPGKLTVTGSVKYDGATGERDTPKARELRWMLGLASGRRQSAEGAAERTPGTTRPTDVGRSPELVWVAGSTHAPEESIVLDVFARLRPRFPHLRLVLVPRHPDRFAEVAQLVERSGLPFARRSQIKEPLPEMPAVVLLDTVGELGAAWGLADVGYTGGSLDGQRGGQSMIEPAGYGVPTVFGPHVWNFRDAARRLIDAGGTVMVRDAAELERELAKLLESTDLRQRMGEAARKLVREQQGATERTLDVLDRVIKS